jgi:cyclase
MVKTRQFKDNIYLGDPINSVRILNDKYIEELIVLDIDAGKNKLGPDINQIKIIASECFSPVTYGGGLRNLDDIKNTYQNIKYGK